LVQADEIADAIKRSETEYKREQTELNAKLDGLRKNLAKQERKLTKLASRRQRVVGILRKWKEHVATLRDAHEAMTVSNAPRSGGLADLKAPPPADKVLSALGISRASKGDSFLRGALAPSDYRRNLDKLVAADKVTGE